MALSLYPLPTARPQETPTPSPNRRRRAKARARNSRQAATWDHPEQPVFQKMDVASSGRSSLPTMPRPFYTGAVRSELAGTIQLARETIQPQKGAAVTRYIHNNKKNYGRNRQTSMATDTDADADASSTRATIDNTSPRQLPTPPTPRGMRIGSVGNNKRDQQAAALGIVLFAAFSAPFLTLLLMQRAWVFLVRTGRYFGFVVEEEEEDEEDEGEGGGYYYYGGKGNGDGDGDERTAYGVNLPVDPVELSNWKRRLRAYARREGYAGTETTDDRDDIISIRENDDKENEGEGIGRVLSWING